MTDEYIRKQDVVDKINANADDLEQNGGIPFAQGARAMVIVVERMLPADVAPVVRCKDCIHNNDCDIQHSAQAGESFFCGFGETEKDVREDVYE